MRLKKKHSLLKWVLVFLIALVIVGCTPEPTVNTIPVTETAPEVLEPVEVENTLTPTQPEIVERTKVLLVHNPDIDSVSVSRIQTALDQLAAESALTLEVREGAIQDGELEDVIVLVALGSGLDVSGLAVNAPQVSFVVIDNPDVSPASNITVIEDPIIDGQRRSFMLGYLVALVASDNKMAVMFPLEIENRDVLIESFVAGARFFCGICRPQYPPYGNFPEVHFITSGNGPQGYQPVVDNFVITGIDIVYVHGDLASVELLTYLAERNIKVIGDSTPDMIGNN